MSIIKLGGKPTQVKFLILLLYLVILGMLFNDLLGSTVSHVNALKSGHMISTICATIWTVLLFQGITQLIRLVLGKSTSWPTLVWFLAFGLLSVSWIYLFMGELSIHELFFKRAELWWLDPSAFYFNENLARICAQMASPPITCTADWFATSDIRNAYLVQEYIAVVHRLVALAPALSLLMCTWVIPFNQNANHVSQPSTA